MTYNFDPDAWFDREMAVLRHRRDAGLIDEAGFEAQTVELERRLHEMVDRLDGSYRLPADE